MTLNPALNRNYPGIAERDNWDKRGCDAGCNSATHIGSTQISVIHLRIVVHNHIVVVDEGQRRETPLADQSLYLTQSLIVVYNFLDRSTFISIK